MKKVLTGGCCCQKVTFEVNDNFSDFYFCYCEQCRKLTGTAHAANLFTHPDNIRWTNGLENTNRYDHPTRSFSMVFCHDCGSALPFVSKSGKYLIVPAGSLDQEPDKQVDAQIFSSEQTKWHNEGVNSCKVAKFPE